MPTIRVRRSAPRNAQEAFARELAYQAGWYLHQRLDEARVGITARALRGADAAAKRRAFREYWDARNQAGLFYRECGGITTFGPPHWPHNSDEDNAPPDQR